MSSETLESLAEITAGTSPKGELINSEGVGLPFFQGSKEFGDLFPTVERHTEHPVRTAKEGDILVSVRAPVGEVNFAPYECAIGRGVMSVSPKSSRDGKFLFYFLKSLRGRWDALGSTGSVFENLSSAALRSVEVPSGLARWEIGEILHNLDLRIESNKSLSNTLESIAQTIFKSWFIDFDPVKAKMVGEKPSGMDESTATLFPHSMEESEHGLIPTGWILRSLDEISDYLNGLAMQKFPVIDELNTLPVIKIAQLRAGNTSGADVASGLLDPRYVINDGDILFSWSGTLEVEIWAGGPGALNQHLFKVTGTSVPDWFSYLSTRHHLPMFRAIASGKATTMGHIQRGHLSEAKIAVPPNELLGAAHKILQPLLKLKLATLVSNRTLLELRDGLLPRLVSGELQIPEETLAS